MTAMQFEFIVAKRSDRCDVGAGFVEIHGLFNGAPCCILMPISPALAMAGAIEAVVQRIVDETDGGEGRSTAVG